MAGSLRTESRIKIPPRVAAFIQASNVFQTTSVPAYSTDEDIEASFQRFKERLTTFALHNRAGQITTYLDEFEIDFLKTYVQIMIDLAQPAAGRDSNATGDLLCARHFLRRLNGELL